MFDVLFALAALADFGLVLLALFGMPGPQRRAFEEMRPEERVKRMSATRFGIGSAL